MKRRIAIAKRANGDLRMMWRNRELPIPLKRKLVQLINDLADNELRFRDIDLPKVSAEHYQHR